MRKAHHKSLCLLPSELARCSPAFASRAATQHECFEVCKGLSTHDKGVRCCACMGHSNDRKKHMDIPGTLYVICWARGAASESEGTFIIGRGLAKTMLE